MISESLSPIQYNNGPRADSPRAAEKNPGGLRAPQAQPATFRTFFPTELNENIVNVYERSPGNIAVPDERTGADRRRSVTRQQYYPESAPLQSDKKITATYLYSTYQKINQTYTRTEDMPPVIFSLSPETGKLIDIWA
jgi:hypothetical protein